MNKQYDAAAALQRELSPNPQRLSPESAADVRIIHQAGSESVESNKSGAEAPKTRQLIGLAKTHMTSMFHDERREPHAVIQRSGQQRIVAMESKEFKQWLRYLAHREFDSMGSEAINNAHQDLMAIARFESEQIPLHNRVARYDGAYYLDLDGHTAVRIEPGKWAIEPNPPILFRYFPHQKALPTPICGGDLRHFLRFVNVRSEEDRRLLLAYLVTALCPHIPIPALVVHGVQGSAKTTLLKLIRRLLDPSAVEVIGTVTQADFHLLAFQHRCIFFDNLTTLPPWLSDALCRTVTGEGHMTRTLYTTEDTTFFQYRRLIGLCGVNLVATKPDLLDRSILLELEPIPRSQRRREQELVQDFDAQLPHMLGGLLDIFTHALQIVPNIHLNEHPRLADFAEFGAAAAEALGFGQTAFISGYADNIERQNAAAVDASPVAQAILELMKVQQRWEGTATALLTELRKIADDHKLDSQSRAWPKAPNSLPQRIREVLPNLMAQGIEIEFGSRHATRRTITISKKSPDGYGGYGDQTVVTAVTAVMPEEKSGTARDDSHDDTIAPYAQPSLVLNKNIQLFRQDDGSDGCDDPDTHEAEERIAIVDSDQPVEGMSDYAVTLVQEIFPGTTVVKAGTPE